MVYKVSYDKKSIDQDKFEFELDGKTYKIKKAKYLNGREALALVGGNLDATYNLFGEEGTELGDAVREVPIDAFRDLVNAWAEDSDMTTGESQAS